MSSNTISKKSLTNSMCKKKYVFPYLTVVLLYLVHLGLWYILSRFLPVVWKDPHLFLWKWISSFINAICCKYYSLFYWMVTAPCSKLTLCTCSGIFSTVRQYTNFSHKEPFGQTEWQHRISSELLWMGTQF